MPVEIATPVHADQLPPGAAGLSIDSRLHVNPAVEPRFLAWGMTTPAAILGLPGEIVSGHPDRHVMRVRLPNGCYAFLKREHRIRWKFCFRNWRAGFGWVCNSVREAKTIARAADLRLPAPGWLAYGEDGCGRAFVLLEDAAGAKDLRHFTAANDLQALAILLGKLCAELHEAGVDHPDLWSKHFLIDPETFAVTIIDWPGAKFRKQLTWKQRAKSLAALRATLVLPTDRLAARFLWAYRRVVRDQRAAALPSFAQLTRQIEKAAAGLLSRRSVRQQRQAPLDEDAQRLVWLDGEALCVIPQASEQFARRALRSKLYDPTLNQTSLQVDVGQARLENGCRLAWLGRTWAWLRGRAWRSPELQKSRLLFHLQRHHVSAPQLIAFGQRCRCFRAEAFVVSAVDTGSTPLREALGNPDPDLRLLLLQRLVESVAGLHAADCESVSVESFRVRDIEKDAPAVIVDPDRIKFRRKLSARRKKADVRRLVRSMTDYCCGADLAYFQRSLRECAV